MKNNIYTYISLAVVSLMLVVDANGDTIAKAGSGEELLYAQVDMAASARIRAARPYTSLRRPALYR